MDAWLMWMVGVAVAALPFALMAAFHGPNTVDSRGRRTDRTWRTRAAGARTPQGRRHPPPGRSETTP